MNNTLQINIEANESYEKRNLSYMYIKDLDFSTTPVSFYRSDFRGTKFSSITFVSNNFDLADFIGSTFLNVEFRNVNWGNSEIKNSYFTKCQFYENDYNDAAVHNTTFEKCVFENEIFRFTMFDCEFNNCQFINCAFDQCTTDNISFTNCQLIKTEMSTMHAENFRFTDCIIRDTYLGSCFLGTYLFKNLDMHLFRLKYRGELQNWHENFCNDTLHAFLGQKRYFEYLNFLLLCDSSEEYSKIFMDIFPKIMEEENINIRNYNIKNSIEMLAFYYNSEKLNFKCFLEISGFLQNIDRNPCIIPKESLLVFKQAMLKLNNSLNEINYDINYLNAIPYDQKCKISIHCSDTSFMAAKKSITEIFECANKQLNNFYEPPYFEVIDEKKGSVILEIASYLLLSLIVAKVIKSHFGTFCEMKILGAETKKRVELIEKSKSMTALEKASLSSESKLMKQNTKQIMDLHSMLGKDYIIDLVIEHLL